jgi:acetyl-CoA synthetase
MVASRPDPRAVDGYDALCESLHWSVPAHFNLAEVCCGRWARDTPDACAIVCEQDGAPERRHRYAELQADANRLSNALRRLGVARGDRIAIVLPQRFETAVAHMASAQLGAVAMPLSMLFGPEALQYRLVHGQVRLAIVDAQAIEALRAARPACPDLQTVLVVGGVAGAHERDWERELAGEATTFRPVRTRADDPAVLVYTSGTTGAPKGALIPHRALIGNLSGFVCSQNGFGFPDFAPAPVKGAAGASQPGHGAAAAQRVFWSPADWAWTGGLMDALLPTLYFGSTIVAQAGRFDPVRAFELLQRHAVTHTFLFPTALKAMMKAVPRPRERYRLALQAVMSAGEAVGDAVFAYGRDELGVIVNEMFGQTEVNYIVGNCALHWPARAGSMGRPYPGHRVAVIDEDGRECPRGTPGDVAVHRRDRHGHPDPVFFLGYWQDVDATRAKFTGPVDDSWCRTGDMAVMDEDGYLWYQGRSDDMFKAAGYRIGPSEIENCLVKDPAVANAAVVPRPDAERGALVKAYVVLAPGHVGDAALVERLQQLVRSRLAPYEVPKDIEFIDALPMTTTGKVQRRVLRLREQALAEAAGRAS